MRKIIILFALLLLASTARAQDYGARGEVFGSVGGGKAYDDEGGIGGGLDFGSGIGVRLTSRFGIEGQVNRFHHQRDFSSGVRFEGTAVFATANAVYHFSTSQVQPYVIGGVGFVHHENRSRFPEDVFVGSRTSDGVAWDFGAGIKFFVNRRISIRPEFRVFIGDAAGSGIESPFSVMRGSVAVSYHW